MKRKSEKAILPTSADRRCYRPVVNNRLHVGRAEDDRETMTSGQWWRQVRLEQTGRWNRVFRYHQRKG
jgi:hypothetical protein